MSPQLREQWMRVRLRSPGYQSSQLLLSQCQRLCALLKKGSNELRGMGHPWGAQETLLPSFRCLPLAASEEQWPTWPQLFSAQQEHPSLMLTGRSHHKAADVLHFCSKCLRKSKKLSSLQLPQALPKPAAELCKLRHRMRLASIPKDWAKLAPDFIRAALGSDKPVIFSIRVPQQSLVLEVTHRSCVGDTYGVWR